MKQYMLSVYHPETYAPERDVADKIRTQNVAERQFLAGAQARLRRSGPLPVTGQLRAIRVPWLE
jgi:hypothetical protein